MNKFSFDFSKVNEYSFYFLRADSKLSRPNLYYNTSRSILSREILHKNKKYFFLQLCKLHNRIFVQNDEKKCLTFSLTGSIIRLQIEEMRYLVMMCFKGVWYNNEDGATYSKLPKNSSRVLDGYIVIAEEYDEDGYPLLHLYDGEEDIHRLPEV